MLMDRLAPSPALPPFFRSRSAKFYANTPSPNSIFSLHAEKWNYDNRGYTDHSSIGTSAELWAWMADGGPLTVDERWIGLRNALAGLFCTSLGSLDDRRTSSPASAFPLSSIPSPKDSVPYALRYAPLQTENLTPFLKLCHANWHGLGIHVRSTEVGTELSLGVQAVLDPVRQRGGGDEVTHG
ncbi:Gpi16 subunit, GPI transamidase component domain containing protein [Tylopilus felleus]